MSPGGAPPRPAVMVAVVGTGTEVGKTWATCAMAGAARARGLRVAARKPVQSFEAPPTDADLLAAATGEDRYEVCPAPRWYPLPMAPPMAAAALGLRPFGVDDLLAELHWPAGVDVGFVETAGGVCSPLADDADCATFAHRLRPDLTVLVADAGLGTINATRLAAGVLAPLPVAVLLNRFDPGDDLHARNRAWLEERDGLAVATDPVSLLPG